jgi:hypothetical protein
MTHPDKPGDIGAVQLCANGHRHTDTHAGKEGRHEMKLFRKRTWIALGGVAAAVAAVGAYAYWTTGGSGSSSGSTAAGSVAIVVNQTSLSSGLYPGGSVALSGNFDNPATFNQYVTSVAASIGSFSYQSDNTRPACTQADFSLSGSPAAVGAQVAPGTGVGSWSGITLNMTNSSANQDNCKSVTVPINYTSN